MRLSTIKSPPLSEQMAIIEAIAYVWSGEAPQGSGLLYEGIRVIREELEELPDEAVTAMPRRMVG